MIVGWILGNRDRDPLKEIAAGDPSEGAELAHFDRGYLFQACSYPLPVDLLGHGEVGLVEDPEIPPARIVGYLVLECFDIRQGIEGGRGHRREDRDVIVPLPKMVEEVNPSSR